MMKDSIKQRFDQSISSYSLCEGRDDRHQLYCRIYTFVHTLFDVRELDFNEFESMLEQNLKAFFSASGLPA